MSDEIQKYAYCSDCSKNVPHCRTLNGQHQRAFRWVLELLRIGPWYCLHCQRKRLVRPSVRGDAADYKIVQPNDPVDPNKPAIWSSSCLGNDDYVDESDLDLEGNDSNSIDEQADLIAPALALSNGAEQITNGAAHEGEFEVGELEFSEMVTPHQNTSSVYSAGQVDLDDMRLPSEEPNGYAFNGNGDPDIGDEVNPAPIPVEVLERVNGASSVILDGQLRAGEVVEMETASPQNTGNESEEIVEAEPVGNFIKDRSLSLKATRIYRFTEKYRDSVVDRILAGKIKISTLTSDGMYTEAELVSWIADKAKRQNKKIETLELDTDPRWSEQRRTSSYGPFG